MTTIAAGPVKKILVRKCGIKRVKGFLYFLDKNGDVCKARMGRGGHAGDRISVVMKTGIKKERGFLYFLDKQGDVSRCKMVNI